MAASAAGIIFQSTYARETANWAGQAVGQDIVNVALAYPSLVVLALVARRGSLKAYLAWCGVLAYSVYTYAIYAFSIRFGAWFLAYVAVFGLSVYALVGGLAPLNLRAVKDAFGARTPTRATAILLFVIGGAFYLLWLSEIVPATLEGDVPPALRDAGLPTNPVYVLDMAILLPAALLTAVLLTRRRPMGYALAPVLLTAMVLIALGIVAAMLVLAARGETSPLPVTIAIAGMAALEMVFLLRFLRGIEARRR